MEEHKHVDDPPPAVLGLDHVALNCVDTESMESWITNTLGLRNRFPGKWNGVPRMMLSVTGGEELGTGIAIFPKRRRNGGDKSHAALDHIAFRVDSESYEEWKLWLGRQDISFDEQDHEVSDSIYFDSPEGITFEMTTYEVDGMR